MPCKITMSPLRQADTVWRRLVFVIVGWGVCTVLAGGCEPNSSSSRSKGDEQTEDARETTDVSNSSRDLSEQRSAFGLPFPPQVAAVRRFDDAVEVDTPMSVEELAKFFRARLVDYEILKPGDDGRAIRIIGLREYMASIEGDAHGSITYLTYLPAPPDPEPQRVDTGVASKHEASSDESNVSASDGLDPSSLEPSSDIAPGAEPGEPYTPPPDSPLHRPRYKSNFGKPFGEWQLP